jgi:F-type H+-transporting ATPase subunit a
MYTQNHYIFNSPLDQFEVLSLFSIQIPLLGYINLTLTNLGLYSLLTIFLIISFHYFGLNNQKLIPSQMSIVLESIYASVLSMVKSQIAGANEKYLPLIYTLFFFIIIANLTGNVPYNFTVTTSVIVTMGLSITIFLSVTIISLYSHGLKFFSYFIPGGTPLLLVPLLTLIEFVSYLARAFSLGIRLFANMLSGHTLIKILSTFLGQMFASSIISFVITLIPFSIFVALLGLELVVSIIQAYVFCILVCSYLNDSIHLH